MFLKDDIGLKAYGCVAVLDAAWRDPVAIAAAFADAPYALVLLSDGSPTARWSYLAHSPAAVLRLAADDRRDPFLAAAAALGQPGERAPDGPPFQGGVAGLLAYEAGARREPTAPQKRMPGWADLEAGLYPAILAFDHHRRRVLAVGRGAGAAEARRRAEEALGGLPQPQTDPAAPAIQARFYAETGPEAYAASVADVVARIGAGEIFQANIARTWRGGLPAHASPFDLFRRVAKDSPAPYAAYFRLPGRAVVSNSPERFIGVDAQGGVETRPIKGTRPRFADRSRDRAAADELMACEKDRAENLMIVDLMRNDLARACEPGSVEVPALCALESFANVHHLVSTVRGRLARGRSALELVGGAFPPGSISGAPKIQAMQVIARHEAPRGPYCGSVFWAGFDGAFDSSVLIRTVAFTEDAAGWRFETRAGAGIVADSDPMEEVAETEAKISALAGALGGRP